MAWDKTDYDMGYYKKNIVRKVLNFNRQSETDSKLLEWLESQGNFSQYIKELVLRDMKERAAQ